MFGALLLLLGALLLLLYRHYSTRNRYWTDRGVPGPQPEFLYGNLRDFWENDEPRAMVFRNWTKQYGKVYGYLEGQQPVRVVSDASLIYEIFVKRFDSFNATAKLGLQATAKTDDMHMAQASGTQWKRLRTLSSEAFSAKSIRNAFPTVKDSARQIVQFIENQQGSEIDAQHYFREFTMDIISKLTLGMDNCRMFENELVAQCVQFFSSTRSSGLFVFAAIFPSLIRYFKVFFFAVLLFVKFPILELTKHVRRTVEERKKQKVAGELRKGDILDMFLDAEADEFGVGTAKNKLSTNEIVANCKLFLLAGYDTTSITLSKAIHFLANHEEIQQRLREEIDDVIGDGDYDVEDIGSLRYAEAVIKETLRLHPVASGFTTRECTTDCEIGKHSFKKGDVIFVDSWSLQRDKEMWGEDAEEFRPERWLEDTPRDRAAFLAFGEGPRICLGMRLALVEAKNRLKMVGSLLLSFDRVPVSMKKRQ